MNKKIALVARQSGTAKLFLEMVEPLREAGFLTSLIATSHAVQIWQDEKLNFIQYHQASETFEILKKINPDIVFTGTSDHPADDSRFWKWSQNHNIPSIGFVESWVNYWQRFSSTNEVAKHFDLLPDFIAVVDDLMANGMIDEGCPKNKIHICGSPLYDKINKFLNKAAKESAPNVSGQIVFVGEPFNPVMGNDEKETLGYTEAEVFELTIRNVIRLNNQNNQQYFIIYKPHPREIISNEIYELINQYKNRLGISISRQNINSWELVYQSGLIVGLYSILLYESMLLGKPVLSIQPNKKIKINNIDRRDGIFLVTKQSDILTRLKELINQAKKMRIVKRNLNSIPNFINFFNEIIKNRFYNERY